jgi:Uma2 family endonuclease
MATYRWTSRDLETLPENGKRYEIIAGELYVSRQPHLNHQIVCSNIVGVLRQWSEQTRLGILIFTPGIIFADDDVVPDVVWVSHERLASIIEPDGNLHAAPELVVEVLSPEEMNARRDRETKLKLYSRRGVLEYWIVNWQKLQIEVYRREEAALRLASTVYDSEVLQSPHLPGFHCQARQLFTDMA